MAQNENTGGLRRTLKTRHLTMIAIGGSIGTGLFLASGSAVSQAGPGGALVAFGLMGLMVYFLMSSLGEMTTFIPVSGSFETYAAKFIDPALAFAVGWGYWFNWAVCIAAELVAGSIIVQFWFPGTSPTMWAVIFLAVLLFLNLLSARGYGEAEYWFSSIKVVTVIIFLIVGILMIFGLLGDQPVGFSNWTLSDGKGNAAPFVGGILTIINVFLIAGFSFSGTESVGIISGEVSDPEKAVPRAIRQVLFRILLFYIGAIIIIGFLIPFTDPDLLKGATNNVAASPFTLVFKNAGLTIAASLVNAVVLTSVLSCGNSGIYAGSRILYAMAKDGRAPQFLGKVSKRGVPVNAILLTAGIAAFSFFASIIGAGKIYALLYNASGLCTFFTWLTIAICHYRFRKAYVAKGLDLKDLKYRAKWYPFGPLYAAILSVVVIFGANVWVFQETLNWFDIITNYMLIPMFVVTYFIYKKVRNTKIVKTEDISFEFEDIYSAKVS